MGQVDNNAGRAVIKTAPNSEMVVIAYEDLDDGGKIKVKAYEAGNPGSWNLVSVSSPFSGNRRVLGYDYR